MRAPPDSAGLDDAGAGTWADVCRRCPRRWHSPVCALTARVPGRWPLECGGAAPGEKVPTSPRTSLVLSATSDGSSQGEQGRRARPAKKKNPWAWAVQPLPLPPPSSPPPSLAREIVRRKKNHDHDPRRILPRKQRVSRNRSSVRTSSSPQKFSPNLKHALLAGDPGHPVAESCLFFSLLLSRTSEAYDRDPFLPRIKLLHRSLSEHVLSLNSHLTIE